MDSLFSKLFGGWIGGRKPVLALSMQQTGEQAGNSTTLPAAPVAATQVAGALNGDTGIIQASSEIPLFNDILTIPGKPLALGESLRTNHAAVLIGSKDVLVLVTPESYGKMDYLSLLQNAKRLATFVSTRLIKQSVLLTLYDQNISVEARQRIERVDDADAPSIQLFDQILREASSRNASDIHFCLREDENSCAVLFRVAGNLRRHDRLPYQNGLEVVNVAFTKLAQDGSHSNPTTFNTRLKQHCTISRENVNGRRYLLRYQSTDCVGGMDVVMRLIPNELGAAGAKKHEKTLEELGYSPSQCRDLDLAARKTYGVTFVTGVTGSGKSTTLRTLAMIGEDRLSQKTYTIEEPVEGKLFGATQINVQRSVTEVSDEKTDPFIVAMRTVLRLDPDNIHVGETRDHETGSLMKTMVHSGHKVYTTLHATSAMDVPERITSEEIGLLRRTISARNFISAIVYQKLIPVLCSCKLEAKDHLDPATADLLVNKFGMDLSTMRVRNPRGCKKCDHQGITNVPTVVAEVIVPDHQFLKYIRDELDVEAEEYWRGTRIASFTEEDCTGKTALEHGLYKVHQGIIDPIDLEKAFEPFDTYQIYPMKGQSWN